MFPAAYRLIEVEETGSTNTACLDAAREGDPGNLWIRAERQSQGRGSRGRSWVSQTGNLLASLLLVDPGPLASLANLTFVASLAVREALVELAAVQGARPEIGLKWPNDVLVSGRKVSGILLEHHAVAGRSAVIVGIGINCASHPDGTTHPATSLAAEGMAVPARDMLELVAGRMAAGIERWDRGANFADIRRTWLAHASGLGKPMTARMPGQDLDGVFEEIDEHGHLVLRLASGRTATVSAADVFFGEAQKADA